jgi:hypothetical protein
MVPPASALDPVAARSLVGLAGLPTIVATGPFDNQPYAEQLAAAFAMVRLRCRAQLVLVGTGAHRATVMRRSFAQGGRASVHVIRDLAEDSWPYLIAAADVVVPSPAAASVTLMDVLMVVGLWSGRLIRQSFGRLYPPVRDSSTGRETCPGWPRRCCVS